MASKIEVLVRVKPLNVNRLMYFYQVPSQGSFIQFNLNTEPVLCQVESVLYIETGKIIIDCFQVITTT